MPLATLQDVKRKLGLADSNAAENESVRAVLLAADRYVLQRTRRALSAGTVTAEVHRNVQIGRSFTLKLRPVTAITTITGRVPNSSQTTTALESDIVDAQNGDIVLLGNNFGIWPPTEAPPAYQRFRDFTYPVVEVTYTHDAYTPTADVSDATAMLAAYWWSRQKAGILKSQSIGGGISEAYLADHLPPGFEEMLAADSSGGSASWV